MKKVHLVALFVTALSLFLPPLVWAGTKGRCPYAGWGFGVPLYLVTLALGYWVLRTAESQGKELKKIGQVIGVVIVLVSGVGLLCKAYWAWRSCCARSSSLGFCPYSGATPESPKRL